MSLQIDRYHQLAWSGSRYYTLELTWIDLCLKKLPESLLECIGLGNLVHTKFDLIKDKGWQRDPRLDDTTKERIAALWEKKYGTPAPCVEKPKPLENDGALCYINVLLQTVRVLSSVSSNHPSFALSPSEIRNKLGLPSDKFQNVQDQLVPFFALFEIGKMEKRTGKKIPSVALPFVNGSLEKAIQQKIIDMGIVNFPDVIPVEVSEQNKNLASSLGVGLNPLNLGGKNYRLKGAIFHLPGHYTAIVKSGWSWHLCDDTKITALTEKQALQSIRTATTFFYEVSAS